VDTNIAVFRGKKIRKTLHNNEWWFVVDDVAGALTDSTDPPGYIKDMRRHDKELSKGWGQIAIPLWIETEGGKQKIDCANTEGAFRIIEKNTSKQVVSPENYLSEPENRKRLKP
jgi:DNA-damage-inducible protein D